MSAINIHVSLLAKAYAAFVGASLPVRTMRRLNPSGYPQSQAAFAERVRSEVESRIGWACWLELRKQTDFSETPIRINTDVVNARALGG
jgi:UDP-glucose 4-epimerase